MIEAVDPGRTDVLHSERVAGGMLPRVRGTPDMLVIVGALVVSALVAQQRLRVVQNAVNAVCVLYGAVILLVLVAGVVYLVIGHPAATDPAALSTWSPSHQHGINFANWTFYGVVVLALLGVEVPLNMGVEIRDRKAVTRYLLWGSAVVILAYLVTTWAVMVTCPPGVTSRCRSQRSPTWSGGYWDRPGVSWPRFWRE